MSTKSTTYAEVDVPHRRLSTESPAVDGLAAAGQDIEVKLRRMVEDGKTRVNDWRGGVQDGIREKPIQTVLIAAAVGAVIGLILGRRS